MAVFNEPTKWAQALGATANADVIPDEAGAMDVDISKIFPAVFSIPLAQGGKAIPRRTLNGLLKLLGDWLYFYQQGGVASYSTTVDYVAGRVVSHNGSIWQCLIANGADEPKEPVEGLYWTKVLTPADIVTEFAKTDLSNVTGTIFDIIPDSAATHNCFYRGKDITADFESGKFSENVANGSFKDIFPGDFIQKAVTVGGTTYSAKWIVGDCDYHLHYGDVETTEHHVLAFPDICLGSSYMNSTNTTTGAFLGSYMFNTTRANVQAAVVNAFTNAHLVTIRELLTNTLDASAPNGVLTGLATTSNYQWTSTLVNIMGESMVYGRHWGGTSHDQYDNSRIIAAFQHHPYLKNTDLAGNRMTWWLRDTVSSAGFASVNDGGIATYNGASSVFGVRPFCLIK